MFQRLELESRIAKQNQTIVSNRQRSRVLPKLCGGSTSLRHDLEVWPRQTNRLGVERRRSVSQSLQINAFPVFERASIHTQWRNNEI